MAKVTRLYEVTYTVKGPGSFPIDMLRYDTSFPAKETQSLQIEADADMREVDLIHRGAKGWKPTYDRWRSFGWNVLQVQGPREVVL